MIYVALLRAVNVGGTGKLPMKDLVAICEAAGFPGARTYLASGNAVFASDKPAPAVKTALEAALHGWAGKPVGVAIRTAAEMAAILAANPFPNAPGDRCMAIFLDTPPGPAMADAATGRTDEQVATGRRELYVNYPAGQGRSRLRISGAASGTARNMNTVAALARMAAESG